MEPAATIYTQKTAKVKRMRLRKEKKKNNKTNDSSLCMFCVAAAAERRTLFSYMPNQTNCWCVTYLNRHIQDSNGGYAFTLYDAWVAYIYIICKYLSLCKAPAFSRRICLGVDLFNALCI